MQLNLLYFIQINYKEISLIVQLSLLVYKIDFKNLIFKNYDKQSDQLLLKILFYYNEND
jgi:hypothetical protein